MISFTDDIDLSSIVYLNERYVPLSEAKISPLDRGFLFADGVYEVIPVYSGSFFCFEMHYNRLKISLESIKLTIDLNQEKLFHIINQLIIKNPGKHQIIYLQITRGVANRNHAFPVHASPTIFAMSSPLIRPSLESRNNGITAITTDDERWGRCDIKSISLLANVLARQKANEEHTNEAILIKDDKLQEGAASSVWVVINNTVLIPRKGQNILEGVRIKIIESICGKLNINFSRRDIFYEEMIKSDEVFLTSATKEVLAITMIDRQKIGNKTHSNKPGPIFKKIQQEYDKLINNLDKKTL